MKEETEFGYAGDPADIVLARQLDGSEVEEFSFAVSNTPFDELFNHGQEITSEMIQKEYERTRSYWQDSAGWKDIDRIRELKTKFELALAESSDTPVTQVVCLGIGGFLDFLRIPMDENWAFNVYTHPIHRYAAFHQLHALELYIHLLNRH